MEITGYFSANQWRIQVWRCSEPILLFPCMPGAICWLWMLSKLPFNINTCDWMSTFDTGAQWMRDATVSLHNVLEHTVSTRGESNQVGKPLPCIIVQSRRQWLRGQWTQSYNCRNTSFIVQRQRFGSWLLGVELFKMVQPLFRSVGNGKLLTYTCQENLTHPGICMNLFLWSMDRMRTQSLD